MIQPYKLSELAQHVQAHLVGDGQEIITGVASLESAQRGQITFLTDAKNRHRLAGCQASAVILTEANRIAWSHNALVVTDPYLAYARIAQLLNNTTPQPAHTIAPTAVIAPDVQLGEQVAIGAYAVLEAGVKIGAGAMIGPHCFIGQNVQIGAGSRLWANVTLYHGVSVGQHCLIHAGAVIGSDGFGFANDQGEWVKIPQLGSVCIGDRVEIGANTTIDRGTLDDTMIHDGVIIDNQCQIAHNVVIGAHTAVAGGVIMAGGLKIGRYCRIGGASVINGHMEICDRVAITGMAMVMRSITEPGVYSSGIPAQPNAYWRKTAAQVLHIDQMNKRLKVLERTIKKSYS